MKKYSLLKTKNYTSYYNELKGKDVIVYVPGFGSDFISEKKVFVEGFLDELFTIVGLVHPGTGVNNHIQIKTPEDVENAYNQYFKEILEHFEKKKMKVHFVGVSMGGMIIVDEMVKKGSSIERGICIATPFSGNALRSVMLYRVLNQVYRVFDAIGLIFLLQLLIKTPLWWPYIALGLLKNMRFSMHNFKREVASWKQRDLHHIIVYMRYVIYHPTPPHAEEPSNKRIIYFNLAHDTRVLTTQCLKDLDATGIKYQKYSIDEYLHSMDEQTKLLVRKYKTNIIDNLYKFINEH